MQNHAYVLRLSTALRRRSAFSSILLIAALLLPSISLARSHAMQNEHPAFKRTWERADYPVATGRAQRSWLWGPAPFATLQEPLAESPGGMRQVQYYDKARMEINDPNADQTAPWFVTNGLLVYEMISGRVQVGNDKFEQRPPARVIVAGETPITMGGAGAINLTPTYESLARVASLVPGQNQEPPRLGQEVRALLSADAVVRSQVANMPSVPTIQHHERATGHNIPDVFWTFMNQRGIVYEGGQFRNGQVFDWLFAMGYPITEPYWIETYVNNKRVTIMMQAFQRRVLTYNPNNPPQWQVEMGNVGMQYYRWRYGDRPAPNPTPGGQISFRRVQTPAGLQSRQYSAIHDPLYTAIATQAEWDAFWTKHTAQMEGAGPAPQVDFKSEFVVAAFWGDKPDGCHTLNIPSVSRAQGTTTVQVQPQVRSGACTTVITQPHDIVAVSRSGLPAGKHTVIFMDSQGITVARAEITLP